MAVKTFYLTNTVASSPDWFGVASETNPAIADTNSRVTVGKIAINQYVPNFMMAGVLLTVQNITPGSQATSAIDARSAPAAGTSASTASTTGDSVRTEAPLTGDFAAGNWTVTWAIRSNSTSTWQGRVRTRVWRSQNIDGSGATLLSSSTILGASTGSMINATTIYTSSATWAAPAISLNNEYLFFQIEYQELVAAGGANGSGGYLRTSQSFVATTNFVAGAVNQTVPPVSITSAAPALAAGTVTQAHVIPASALATGVPAFAAGGVTQEHLITAAALATGAPVLTAAAVAQDVAGNVIRNGGFISDTEWDHSASATISGGVATITNGAKFLTQTNCLEIGVVYDFSFDLVTFSGSGLRIGNHPTTNAGDIVYGPFAVFTGKVSGFFTAVNTAFSIEADNAVFSGTIDNVVAVPRLPTVVPAGSLATASPALAGGAVTQKHVVSASALASASPSFATGAVSQKHVVAASALTTASPILLVGAVTQKHTVALTGETVGALTLPTLVTTTAAALQYLTPMADVNLGGWTNETGGTSLYGSIDEAAPNVADYIRSSLDPVNDSCVFELSDPAAPLAAPVTVSYLYGKETNNADRVDLTARLLQGATEIAVWVHADIPYTATQADQLLTAPQRAAIGDASALRLEFIANPVAANFVALRDGSAVTDRAGNPITLRA